MRLGHEDLETAAGPPWDTLGRRVIAAVCRRPAADSMLLRDSDRCFLPLLDPLPVGRLPFHQIGQPAVPRYLCPRESVFQPPLFALGIRTPSSRGLVSSSLLGELITRNALRFMS